MQCNCKCNSLFTSFPSHQVSIFTHMHSIHFSVFSVHYPQCTSRLWRHTNTCRIMDITQYQGTMVPAAIFCAWIGTCSRQNWSKRWESWNIVGPYIAYNLLQTKGEMCAKFGSETWICISYIQTNKLSSLYIRQSTIYNIQFFQYPLHIFRMKHILRLRMNG
jgi:hypothetical protein